MEMRKSESVDKQLSYKPAIIELVELSATSLFTIYRIQILSFFGIHMRKFCLVDKLLCCVLMFLMLYFFDQFILDFFNVHEKRKKLKGDKRGCAEFKGKQYSLEEISKMLRESDIIEIDIPARTINVRLTDEELAARPMTPVTRDRYVPKSLKAYASMVSSADKGAVRIID